jgi:cytochrome c oxidase accessory protein FixG
MTTPAPSPDATTVQWLYAAGPKVVPRSVKGTFATWRWIFVWATQLAFYGVPWLEWGQRQAVLFDLEARRFYLAGLVLYPQDFIYLTGLLIASALSLFLFTTVAGRQWCGYACPQSVYSEMFLWIERRTEGDRAARLRLDDSSWSGEKLARKGAKHALWLALALWTGFTFVGYFTPIRDLMTEVRHLALGPWEIFWIGLYSLATWGNAGFMREQVCKYMCPYARFQSAMFDKDTLIVTYDSARGEPRGPRSPRLALADTGKGACVDCGLCVQVCPTGIDIRKGLQYECISCAGCVDVCNSVMDKFGYPRGLVRYTTTNALEKGWSTAETFKRVLRPRVLIYTTLLSLVILSLAIGLALRVPFKLDVVRDRGSLARIVEGGYIENVYRLQVMNATEQPQRYELQAQGMPGLKLSIDGPIEVGAAQSRWVPVRLQVPGDAPSGSHPVEFVLGQKDQAHKVAERAVFIVPQ